MEDSVTVSLGPLGYLFQQLRFAIAWQYRRLKGVKTDIQILGQGLEGLCTDLKDLSEAEDTLTRCWVRQVRDLCYDTSDYLDELMHFIHCSSGTRPKTRLFSENRLGSKVFRVSRRPACNNQLLLPLPKVKKLQRVTLIAKLSRLIARVEDADERRRRFKLSLPRNKKGKRFKLSPRQASKHDYAQPAGDCHFTPQIPPQHHVDNLIKLLGFHQDHDERNPKVATIFGSAGVGKTAVARTIYQKCRGRFQYSAFLRVSRDPDMRRLLADLLSQIKAPLAHAFLDVELLIAAITKHLQGKSYLIVIQDLWDTSIWDIISRALPDGDYCRIITTTQLEDVALACCSDQLKHIYEMTPLNDDQPGISEGVCTAHPSTEGMNEALNHVYINLPPHLKTCLLYMNIYPDGWTVKKGELVKQWVAEGFIGSEQGQDAEKNAGRYFDDLIGTGMVQSVDTNHNDEVLSCTLHHMVLDLIRQKSMEENFITIVNYFQTNIGLPDKVRRLSVQLGGAKGANNISGNMRISQVRSLIFCGFFKSVPSIMEYGLLQVLILHIWSDQDRTFDLTSIGELYRLRYLKIECSTTVKLPHKIRRLRQLGTLQVDSRLYAVPSDIVHLEKLLHLHISSESILPHGVGRMTRLRTLGYFDLASNSEDNVRDLGELKNLQDLQLTCSAVQPAAECLEKNVQLLLSSVLKQLTMLQSVTLVPAAGSSNVNTLRDRAGASIMHISCDGSRSMFSAPSHLRRFELSRRCCILCRLPKWLGELAQLCILKIAIVELSKEDIGILIGLPALASLSLNVVTMSTEEIVFGKEGFSVLRYFKFTCTATWLKFEAGAMPKLEKLKLRFIVPMQIIIIERLSGLKEISATIGYAGVDAESALWKAISNDPRNPEVQLTGPIYYRDQGKGMVTREGSREDGYNEVDSREHMRLESSRLLVPAARRMEKEPEDRSFISEIISIPEESYSADGYAGGQVYIEDSQDLMRETRRETSEQFKALPGAGENADHLKGMAAQLLAMLSAHVDWKKARMVWDELRQKLAQIASYVADTMITAEALLGLLEHARGPSSLRLGQPEAEALLRQIMGYLRETISVADTGMAIPRFSEALLVVADQLNMLPLRDSDHVHIVDGDTNFCDSDTAAIIMCSRQLSAPNAPYAVVSIVGAQSSGKSYLLNRLFGTMFPEMNARHGRSQTTKGIMMSRCIGPSLLVLDVEGFDGRDRGQDTLFEKQAALFALTVSDVMLVNMSVFDIGREQGGGTMLFETIFQERTKLPAGLTKILVVLRMYDGEIPIELLKDDVMESLKRIWKYMNVESMKFEDYIEVNVVGLPDKNSRDFHKEVTGLRRLLSKSTLDHNGSAKVPASSFSVSSRKFWDIIKENEKLDIPSHQEAVARSFCRQAVEYALKSLDSREDYKLLKAEESPRRFRDMSDTLHESIVTMYDHVTEKYDPKVRDKQRQYMVEKLRMVFIEDSRELVRKMLTNASEQFKGEYAKNLENMEETDDEINYDDQMVYSCVEEFMKSCKDLEAFDSEYLQTKCLELKKDLHFYTLHQILTIKGSTVGSTAASSQTLKRNSDDMGWEFATLIDPLDLSRVKCKLCGKEMHGGVNRMKQHIAGIKGQVSSCMVANADQQKRCREASEAPQKKKKLKEKHDAKVAANVVIDVEVEDNDKNDEEHAGIGDGEPRKAGPMDKYVMPIDPSVPLKKFQQNINDAIDKERSYKVGQYLARWIYKKNIPFNAVNDDDFKAFCEALSQFGPGWKTPSQYMLREKMLLQEVERTKDLMKPHELERVATGCSVMTDAWTDKKRRSILNLCVNCKLGTAFLGSKEASADAHTSQYIFDYVVECIEKIGVDNVMQVVTDNASNNMGAKEMLKGKFPKIFWTSCATHTLNLMVEAIGKLKQFGPTITKAKEMTIFLYAHHKTLSLMRSYTKKRDIVRPGVTRFASAFLTLQSLVAKKKELRAMVCSDEWEACKPTRTKKGKSAHATIMSRGFWKSVSLCIKVFEPLVKVLRLADGDGPSMATMYGEIISAKKDIMLAVENSEKDYLVITNAMDGKMIGRLDSPLHMAAYMLNPKYSYVDSSIFTDVEVMAAFMEVMETFFYDDGNKQNVVFNIDFTKFKKKDGMFGKVAATKAISNANYDAAEWWGTYGLQTPALQEMAIRILNLTTSSSGCERNWSTYEMVDAKRRNRLDVVRRDNMVYVQFNGRMIDKRKKLSSCTDPLLGEDASRAQDWICEDAYIDEEIDPVTGLSYNVIDEAMGATEAMKPRRSARVRELYEVEEFISDDDELDHGMDVEEDIDFESDDDGVMATKDDDEDEETQHQ